MDNSVLEQNLQKALDLHEEGNDYGQIRTSLSKEGLESETISYIIRLVDEFVVEEEKLQEKLRTAKLRMIFGGLVSGIGILFTYMFYAQEVLSGYYMIIAYFPLVVGAYLVWSGWRNHKRWSAHQPEIDDTKFRLVKRF